MKLIALIVLWLRLLLFNFEWIDVRLHSLAHTHLGDFNVVEVRLLFREQNSSKNQPEQAGIILPNQIYLIPVTLGRIYLTVSLFKAHRYITYEIYTSTYGHQ